MFEAGVVEEVRQVLEDPDLVLSETAGKAIGFREITQLLRGELNEDEAITQIQQATRRYAKRQQTWFRNQLQAATCNLTTDDPESAAAEIVARLTQA